MVRFPPHRNIFLIELINDSIWFDVLIWFYHFPGKAVKFICRYGIVADEFGARSGENWRPFHQPLFWQTPATLSTPPPPASYCFFVVFTLIRGSEIGCQSSASNDFRLFRVVGLSAAIDFPSFKVGVHWTSPVISRSTFGSVNSGTRESNK